MSLERSQKLLVTVEARALKQIREAKGLSMKQAALAIGMSKPYIAHIEGGRMAVPKEEKLLKLLRAYGIFTHKSFYDRVRNFKERVTPRDERQDLASRLPDEKIQLLLGLAKALAEGRAVVSFCATQYPVSLSMSTCF
jgi:transcriptional regulator with XRE-family HTH domain